MIAPELIARRLCLLLVLTLFAAVGGCSSGSGSGLPPVGGGSPLTAEFSSIQDNVFTPTCATAGCHVGAAAPLGLRLDAASSYALLVGIPSSEVPALLRVDPGNPDDSYLIQKLEGTAAVGGRMPLNGPPFLEQATVDTIRQWITDGALPDPADAGPPRVVLIEPADSAVVDQLPGEITVVFSRDMDGALFSDTTVIITRSGGDGTFTDGNEETLQPTAISPDAGNPRVATVDLSGVASADDDYQIRLVGTGATALASQDGQILDGDADGQAGGDFVSTFSVTVVMPTLQSIQENVFAPTCATAGCHEGPIGPDLPSGQDLSTLASSFTSLVGVPSVQDPSLQRVNPGNADDSYLIRKLEGTASEGARMPFGRDPLAQATIDAIRAWIDAGAESGGADVSAPTVELEAVASPVSGTITLSATAMDDTGVTQVTFLVDGVPIGSVLSDPYTFDWDSTAVADGDHELTAEARDAAGNLGISAPHAVTVANDVDATPPEVSLNPLASPLFGTVTVSAVATDNVSVAQVDFFVDGMLIGSDTTNDFEVQWDTTTVSDGAHELIARAVDGAGNSSDSTPMNVEVDNSGCGGDVVPPMVSLTTPAPGVVMGSITVSADANDDVGVTSVAFFAGVVLIGNDATAPYQVDWDTTTVANGDIVLTAEATDGCNTTTSAAVTVTVDNAAVVFAVSTVNPGAGAVEVDFPSSITVTFTDNVDTRTVDAASFILERSGGDGTFGDGNEEQLNGPVSANGAQASMDLSSILPSFEDTYRVTLSDTITDLGGNMLDGDGDGSAGGNFITTFQTDLTTYTDDAQPIFLEKCDTCHTGDGLGDHNIGIVYPDALLPADDGDCVGLTIGQCTIVLVQEGEMPLGAGCSGDPAQDAGNAACLTQAEQNTLQAWIDDRLPE